MKTPLIPIDILSIYKNSFGDLLPLPRRMALCTPDTYLSIFDTARELAAMGGKLILSDLYRTYEMQFQSHHDYATGRKKAFSPPPGGSFHEAGRAFDMDLGAMKIPLSEFWRIAARNGLYPIIKTPNPRTSEAWHFDCRGSHQIVYEYYANGMGNNFVPYKAAAASAILSTGVQVDYFTNFQKQALIQSCLIRLGTIIGNMDGRIGKNTQRGLEECGISNDLKDIDNILVQLENKIQEKFEREFKMPEIHLQ